MNIGKVDNLHNSNRSRNIANTSAANIAMMKIPGMNDDDDVELLGGKGRNGLRSVGSRTSSGGPVPVPPSHHYLHNTNPFDESEDSGTWVKYGNTNNLFNKSLPKSQEKGSIGPRGSGISLSKIYTDLKSMKSFPNNNATTNITKSK